jgi:hypothetical protein
MKKTKIEPITEERLQKMAQFTYEESLKNGHPIVDCKTQKRLTADDLFIKMKKTFSEELKKTYTVKSVTT